MKHLDKILGSACIAFGLTSTHASAALIASWTFETSLPAAAGPFAPEVGTGQALGFHSNASAVYSNPVGNGSVESFSSNFWSVGDYYQFSTSTTGFAGISLSWDQTSSSTGPRDFKLAYSTDGITFNDSLSYQVLVNGAPNAAWNSTTNNTAFNFLQNLSAIPALDNVANVYFRLIDTSTIAVNGASVATAGTDRVDNFSISGTAVAAVPLPAALPLLAAGMGLFGWIGRRREGLRRG